jgi:hypothetical protein
MSNQSKDKEFESVIDGIKIKMRLADRPGKVRAWVDINTGNRWIYNCTLVNKDNRFFLNPPQFFDKDLVGMPIANNDGKPHDGWVKYAANNDGKPHDGWVKYADFNSNVERKKCSKAALKAYFQMIKKMM